MTIGHYFNIFNLAAHAEIFEETILAEETPGGQTTADNSVIREMREQIRTLESKLGEESAARVQAQQRATQLEREKMTELERLQAELQDRTAALAERDHELAQVAPLRDEMGRYQSAAQQQYELELQGLPEDRREKAVRLTSSGSWVDRLESLRDLKEFGRLGPRVAGTRTHSVVGAPEPAVHAPRQAFSKAEIPGWSDALKQP